MTDRALLQQALEALEWNLPVIEDYGDHEQLNRQHRAIAALRERLAQPEQEPVAVARVDDLERGGRVRALAMRLGLDQLLYTSPPQRKPLTEKRIEELYSFWVVDCQDIVGFARAVERTVKGEA